MDTLEVSAKLARSRLDDVESTVLTFILFIRSADLHGVDSAHLSAMLNEVFRNLAMHYQQSYEDYALRLDVIVHMADEILVWELSENQKGFSTTFRPSVFTCL